MLAAAVQAVEEVGYAGMTVAQVITRARVSRRTFYDVFDDREDCFLGAFEQAIAQAREPVSGAYAKQDNWQDGVRAGLSSLLAMMDRERGLAKLCVVEAMGAGERALALRATVLQELAAVIDGGRRDAPARRDPPGLTAEGIVSAVAGVLHTRLHENAGEPLSDLLGALMSIIVLPYMGTRAARAELELAGSGSARRSEEATARLPEALGDLNMRLTYRTVMVLGAIAAMPGASNREIAVHSGIADQGQISKLLNRLARLELAENRGAGPERGAPNAWYLTGEGMRIERATRAG
jgi:AcrR family transcriptional regulator